MPLTKKTYFLFFLSFCEHLPLKNHCIEMPAEKKHPQTQTHIWHSRVSLTITYFDSLVYTVYLSLSLLRCLSPSLDLSVIEHAFVLFTSLFSKPRRADPSVAQFTHACLRFHKGRTLHSPPAHITWPDITVNHFHWLITEQKQKHSHFFHHISFHR